MARARTLVLDTRVNVTGTEKLKGLSNSLDSAGARLRGALNPGNLLAAAGIGVGISSVIGLIEGATNAAAEFNDSVSATGVIFSDELTPQMQAWADEAHANFGASKQDALSAANQFAVFGKSAGLAGQELVSFSQEMVQLGGDLASFFGGTTEDAIGAVGAALRGEAEPIRRYGVLLDDATLKARAFELGLISTTKNALTPQQRVLAAHAEILAQTSDAQGDFVRTSEGMANQQRSLAAQLENVNIELGEKLMPVMLELVTFLTKKGIPALREFIDLLNFEDVNSAQGIPILGEIEDFLNTVSGFGDRNVLEDMLHFDPEIERAARQLGITYGEMADKVEESIERTGRTQFRVIQGMTQEFEALPETANTALFGITAAWKENDLGQLVAESAAGIPEALQAAQDEAAVIARKTPGALADQLRAGIEDYDEALTELADVAAKSVSDLSERQKIEGILASQELTNALSSDSTRTRLLAADFVDDLISDYELLAPGAFQAGQLVNPRLAAGLESNVVLARNAAGRVRDAAGNVLGTLGPAAYGWGQTLSSNFLSGMSSYQSAIRAVSIRLGDAAATGLRLRSPAEAGALSEPADKWGLQLGQTFAAGMLRSVPGIEAASVAMGGAAVPGLNVPAIGGLSSTGTGLGGTTVIQNYYLQWDGESPKGRTEEEIIATLQRLSPLVGGKLAAGY